VAFNIFSGYGRGTNFVTGGVKPLDNGYLTTGAVDIASGDPIAVHLGYDGTTLSESLTDTVSNDFFQTSYTTDLPHVLGSDTAYVGFTGASGLGVAVQQISDFHYTPAVPEATSPVSLGLLLMLGLGGVVVTIRKQHKA